jgi:hypothetical protein
MRSRDGSPSFWPATETDGAQRLVGEHGRDAGDAQAGHAAVQVDGAAADHVGAVLEHGDLDDASRARPAGCTPAT